MKLKNMTSIICFVLFGQCFLPGFMQACLAFSEDTESVDKSQPGYYLLLREEEFLMGMVPKERFLLEFAKQVNEEISLRRRSGVNVDQLGIRELVSPDEKLVDAYQEELQGIIDLINDIEELESLARQRVNLDVLETLESLKNRLSDMIGGGESEKRPASPVSQEQSTDTEIIEDEKQELDSKAFENLFSEWRYTRLLNFKLQETRYQFLRTRLLRDATPQQENRMFRTALRTALEVYSDGDLELARLLLKDILNVYDDGRILDDVMFYTAETAYGLNLLDEAIDMYDKLYRRYPQSNYAANAVYKQIFIYYIYGQYEEVFDLFNILVQRKEEINEENWGTVSYLTGYSYFRTGKYSDALQSLRLVPPRTTYFYPALYLSAACFSNLGQNDQAIYLYEHIINEPVERSSNSILAQIKDNALLKRGLIAFEQGQNNLAISFLNRVSTEFEQYDLTLMGRAWSAYRAGRPGEVLKNVEGVLKSSIVSSYVYEARVLAASSKEILGRSEEAIEDLKQVFQAGRAGTSESEASKSTEADLSSEIKDFEQFQRDMLDARERALISEMEHIRRFFQFSPARISYTSQNGSLDSQTRRLESEIASLDQMEQKARQAGNQNALSEIRRLRSNLLEMLDNHSRRFSISPDIQGSDPFIGRLGRDEHIKYMFSSLLAETMREKRRINQLVEKTRQDLVVVQQAELVETAIRLEIDLEEQQDYYSRLNQYEVWLRENSPQETHVELDRWASFSGYGISSISFSRIKDLDSRISHISRVISNMDNVYNQKRKELEVRIHGLLSDVAAIEKQMQQDSAIREQEEKTRFFRTDYFDQSRVESVIDQKRKNEETGEVEKKKDDE